MTKHEIHEARHWYLHSRQAIKRVYGKDWKLFAGLLACTSPNTSIKGNITLARKAYNEIKETGHINTTGYIHAHVCCIDKFLKTGYPSGRKAKSFYLNLTGLDKTVVTVDIWMCRYAGINRDVPTSRQYMEIEDRVREEAEDLGINPCDRQSEIWVKMRGNSISFRELLAQQRMF
jgi:hypothetical protein